MKSSALAAVAASLLVAAPVLAQTTSDAGKQQTQSLSHPAATKQSAQSLAHAEATKQRTQSLSHADPAGGGLPKQQ